MSIPRYETPATGVLLNTEGVLETIAAACCEVVVTPSPQPLSRQGRGAKKRDEIPASSEAQNSPPPSRERGGGRGGDGQ